MGKIYCEYDEKTKHNGCKYFPCPLCNVENEKKVLKELLHKIRGDLNKI